MMITFSCKYLFDTGGCGHSLIEANTIAEAIGELDEDQFKNLLSIEATELTCRGSIAEESAMSIEAIAVKLKYTEVYHSTGCFGHIHTFLEMIRNKCVSENASITACWNGTIVNVQPGDSLETIYDNWSIDRRDYQRLSNPYHPALCPVCEHDRGNKSA